MSASPGSWSRSLPLSAKPISREQCWPCHRWCGSRPPLCGWAGHLCCKRQTAISSWALAGSWRLTQRQDRLRGGPARSHRCQLGRPSDQPPPGDMGFDRGSRPRGSGRADSRRVSKRPARVAVLARSRRAGVADFHIRTDRGDPDTPPQGAQRRAVHALEATAQAAKAEVVDRSSPTTVQWRWSDIRSLAAQGHSR